MWVLLQKDNELNAKPSDNSFISLSYGLAKLQRKRWCFLLGFQSDSLRDYGVLDSGPDSLFIIIILVLVIYSWVPVVFSSNWKI